MFDHLKALLTGGLIPEAHRPDYLRTAVATLLVEAALSADGFEQKERDVIEALLKARFGLSSAEARELIDAGDHAAHESADIFAFTKQILEGMTPEGRVDVVEMLWEVAYADGHLDPEEERLIVKIAGLLYVSAHERNEAKRRAMAKAGLG